MALDDFRAVYFPYCLEEQDDGTYVVLNREYKPVGFNTKDFIDYGQFPVGVKFKLTPAKIRDLTDGEGREGRSIYLYNDRTNPLNGKKHMDAYLEKLRLLAKLGVT